MAKRVTAKNASAAAGGPSTTGYIALGLFLMASVLLLPFALLIAVGMLPTMMAALVDNRAERNITLTVGIMNLCGIVPSLVQLWQHGPTIVNAIAMIGNPVGLMMMFAGAAFGWLLVFAMPPLIGYVISVKAADTIIRLEQRMQQLRQVWGDSLREAVIELSPEEADAMFPDTQL